MDDELLFNGDCILLTHSPKSTTRLTKMADAEEIVFDVEQVSNIIKQVIERRFGNNPYQHDQINRWTAETVDQILTELTLLRKRFKYVVKVVTSRKYPGGLHAASSCYWNDITDGSCTIRWENDHVYVIASVFGLKIIDMCGRFACGLSPDVVRRLATYMHSQTKESTLPPFIDLMPKTRSFRPSWNIAPTSTCLCLISAKHLDETEDSSTRVLCSMRWSLVPSYYNGTLSEFKPVLNNCRSETIDEKPTFKRPLKSGRRCVILAEGFFEWKKNVPKMPYFIYQTEPFINEKHYPDVNVEKILERNGENKLPLLAMAGLFDINRNCETDPLYSCTICTVPASKTMQNVHVRMPAILSTQQAIDEWLDFGRYSTTQILPLLVPNNDIQMYRVTPNVGSTKINDVNNIRSIDTNKENKVMVPNRNTLDSFVIKKAPSKYFNDHVLKDDSNKTSYKRAQTAMDDYMDKETKPTVKRLKK